MSSISLFLRLRLPRPQERGSLSPGRYDNSETSILAFNLRVGGLARRVQELEDAIFCLLCIHTYRIASRLCVVVWVALSTDEKETPSASRGVEASQGLAAWQPGLHLTISVTPHVSCRGTAAAPIRSLCSIRVGK